jgi:hypothetical protein
MNDTEVAKSNEYWLTITRNEEFINQYGHNAFSGWEDKEHLDLVQAYEGVRPYLESISRKRMFYGLPGELNPFPAENYHHALVLFLSPPERWFGNIGVLTSPEYLALKQGAEKEESECYSHRGRPEEPAKQPDDLSPAEQAIYAVIDATPRMGPEIAKRIGTAIDPDNIRRDLSQLKKRGHIGHRHGQGYFRL